MIRWSRSVTIPATLITLVAVSTSVVVASTYLKARHNLGGTVTFDQPLPIPPLAKSTIVNGTRVFKLKLKQGHADFGQGLTANTSYYAQDTAATAAQNTAQYLAPTLRAARGERVQINVTNKLGTTSTLHWHGMHLPAAMDGGPHQLIAPGTTWQPRWTIKQPAATLWYHPHLHGSTETQVRNGLTGVFLLDDPSEPTASTLPHAYGVDDVPVILQDKKFGSNGVVDTSPPSQLLNQTGFLGDRVVANGKVGAYLTATTTLLRLRLVNGSTARIYNLGFDDGRRFSVIAGDGGLLEQPVRTDHVVLSPGDRLEIVVAVAPGDRAMLQTSPIDLGGGFTQRLSGGDDTLDVLQLRGANRIRPSTLLPAHLTTLPAADPKQAVKTREFHLSAPTINGQSMDMNRIDATVVVGTSEIWRVYNDDDMAHNFHIHDTQFRVVSVNGVAPPVEMQGYQDTVLLTPGSQIELLVSFADYTDPNTPYMFHCHLLWHEDRGMMGQFVVVAPGQQAGTVHDPAMPGMATGF